MILAALGLLLAMGSSVAAEPASIEIKAELQAVQAYDGGDIATAAELWRALAEAGSLDAALALASLVEPGGEGQTDTGLARALYRTAADAGDALAAYNLEKLDNQFGVGPVPRVAEHPKSERTQ